MGRMDSPAPAVKALQFEPFPTKPLRGTVVRVGHRPEVVVAVSDGRIYTNCVVKRHICMSGPWELSADLAAACYKLGLIDAEAKKLHVDWQKAERARQADRSAYYAAHNAFVARVPGFTKAMLEKAWTKLSDKDRAQMGDFYSPDKAKRE